MAITINADTSNGLVMTPDTSGEIKLQSAGTDTVTVKSDGKVGIGTSSPSYKLQVAGGAADNNNTANVIVIDGENHSRLKVNTSTSGGYQASLVLSSGEALSSTTNEVKISTTGSQEMRFTTANAERMRIDSSGNCFWNGTSIIENTKYNFYFTSATNGIGSKVDTTATSYHARWHNPNGVVGGIYTSGSNTTYTTSSDYRLKENILPMTGALDKVMQLNPVTYTWKLDGSNGQGFIAHELQSIVPECVGGEKDAVNEDGSINPQGVDTSFLVATLTAAIQEQQKTIKDLETRIQALENA